VIVKGIIGPFMNVDYMVYQLKYDNVHKRYPGTVCSKKDGDEVHLVVNEVEIQVFQIEGPADCTVSAPPVPHLCEWALSIRNRREECLCGACSPVWCCLSAPGQE
jgi:hypothetical protein